MGEIVGIHAVVLLNESDGHFFAGYQPGAALRQAAAFELDPTLTAPAETGVPIRALEIVWHELNVDVPTAGWARRYRAERNRSLSVGDVVILGEAAYAVTAAGWMSVALAAEQISQ